MSEMENYNNFPASSFPKDDYALTILTQAAMHTRHSEDPNTLAYEPERHKGRNVTTEAADTTSSNQNRNHQSSSVDAGRQNRTLSGYNSDIFSSRSMETLTFNPSLGHRPNPYMPAGYRGIGNQISQNYANNLGILNAESYDDGRGTLRERDVEEMRSRMRSEKTMPFGMERPEQRIGFENVGVGSEEDASGKGRRKKRKDESADEEEEARKKARGRPRVDTKDETAADVSFNILFYFLGLLFREEENSKGSGVSTPGKEKLEDHVFID
jgi:hypothetical protein